MEMAKGFDSRLLRARKFSGKTIDQCAAAVYVSRADWQSWERDAIPTDDQIVAIAEALGIQLLWLWAEIRDNGKIPSRKPPAATVFVALALTLLCAVAVGQELPRSELIEHCRKAREAKIEPLAAELKTVQANLKKVRNREAIIAARQRETEIKAKLAAIEKAGDAAPGIDIAKLEPGQIGTLYRTIGVRQVFTVADSRGPQRVDMVVPTNQPVNVTVAEVIDANTMLVDFDGTPIYMRTPTAGLVAGKKLTLDMPVKVVGVRKRGAEPMFELATFAKE